MNARASQLTGARGARDRGATHVEQLAECVCHSGWEDISDPAREQLKLRVIWGTKCLCGRVVTYGGE